MSLATTRAAAVRAGISRGIQIAVDPDPARLRALSEAARSRDPMGEAWQMVGDSLDLAIAAQKAELRSRKPSHSG